MGRDQLLISAQNDTIASLSGQLEATQVPFGELNMPFESPDADRVGKLEPVVDHLKKSLGSFIQEAVSERAQQPEYRLSALERSVESSSLVERTDVDRCYLEPLFWHPLPTCVCRPATCV